MIAAGVLMTIAANAATATLYSAGVRAWPVSSPPGSPYNFLTQPAGALFVGSHLWVGDGLQSSRLDAFGTYMPMPGISTPYASLNGYYSAAVTVPIQATGQIAYDPVRRMAYSTERQSEGQGVWRAQFDPLSERFMNGYAFASGTLGGRRPTAAALGPDGQLYVGFVTSSDIVRIPVNTLDDFTCLQFSVTTIGKSQFGNRIASLVFVGSNLYVAGKDGLGVIRNATACASGCTAAQVPGSAFRVDNPGLTTDGADTIYYLRSNAVWRYTISTGAHVLFANSGTFRDGTTTSFLFANGQTNTLQLDALGNLWVGDDPSDGIINLYGRIWFIQA